MPKPRATQVYKQPRRFPNLCSLVESSLFFLRSAVCLCAWWSIVVLCRSLAVAGTDAQATKKFSGPHYYFAEAMVGRKPTTEVQDSSSWERVPIRVSSFAAMDFDFDFQVGGEGQSTSACLLAACLASDSRF